MQCEDTAFSCANSYTYVLDNSIPTVKLYCWMTTISVFEGGVGNTVCYATTYALKSLPTYALKSFLSCLVIYGVNNVYHIMPTFDLSIHSIVYIHMASALPASPQVFDAKVDKILVVSLTKYAVNTSNLIMPEYFNAVFIASSPGLPLPFPDIMWEVNAKLSERKAW